MQFTGTVQSFDADEGVGYIVREPDRHEVVVRSAGLALGVDSLSPGDRVEFDIDMGTTAQARNVVRCRVAGPKLLGPRRARRRR